jgi:hypothetical protein
MIVIMKAVFAELPAFERHRKDYLDDDAFSRLQEALMGNPEAGDLIEGTGGCARCALAMPVEARASAEAFA